MQNSEQIISHLILIRSNNPVRQKDQFNIFDIARSDPVPPEFRSRIKFVAESF